MGALQTGGLKCTHVPACIRGVIQIGDRARIIISTRIVDIGSIRFSIAHEIGHLLCKHYAEPDDAIERPCSPLHPDGKATVREADVFAAELLTLRPIVTPWCAVQLKNIRAGPRDRERVRYLRAR